MKSLHHSVRQSGATAGNCKVVQRVPLCSTYAAVNDVTHCVMLSTPLRSLHSIFQLSCCLGPSLYGACGAQRLLPLSPPVSSEGWHGVLTLKALGVAAAAAASAIDAAALLLLLLLPPGCQSLCCCSSHCCQPVCL